jgi:hypothetical protein
MGLWVNMNMITVVTMFAPAKEGADCEIALWRLRASSRKANLRGVFHSFIKKVGM